MVSLEIPERRSLPDIIFEKLEAMILSGQLKPGDSINEKALSDTNGFSRAPLREACRRLEQAGLVEIIVNRGAFVRTLSRRTAEELCELRVLLASYAAKEAVKRLTNAEVAALSSLKDQIESAACEEDLSLFYALNSEFHMSIIRGCGNERLVEMYTALNKELYLFRWRALSSAAEFAEQLSAHRSIVATLLSRDVEGFSRAVEEHLRAATKRLLESAISLGEESPANETANGGPRLL